MKSVLCSTVVDFSSVVLTVTDFICARLSDGCNMFLLLKTTALANAAKDLKRCLISTKE